MPLYMIYCVDRPGAGDVRAAARDEHMAYLHSRDEIVLAGAKLSDDGETAGGSTFIVNVVDRAAAQAFSDGDPFSKAGLFDSVTITRIRKGLWHPERAEDA
jgi:uncharacterized protein YciI